MASRVQISKRLVFFNSTSSLLTHLLNVFILVWLQQYLLNRISPEEYSLLPVLNSVMMFAPLITTVLTAGLGRYITEAYAKDDDRRITQIVSTMFPILAVTGALFLAAGWGFAWYVDHILTIPADRLWDARIMMALLMFSAAVRLPLAPFGVGLFARQKFVLQNVIQLSSVVLRLTLLCSLLFGVSTRVLWVVLATVSAELLNLFVAVIVSRRLLPTLRFKLAEVYWPIAGEITSFGGWSFVASVANTVRNSADAIILNKLAMPIDVTCYYLGGLPRSHMDQMVAKVHGSLDPVLIGMSTQENYEKLRSTYLRIGRYTLWGTLFFGVPAMIYRKAFFDLYVGPEFKDAATVMGLLIIAWPIWYGHSLLPRLAIATGQIKPMVKRSIAIQILNLALTFYVVGGLGMGAVGSALASIISGGLGLLCLLYPLAFRLTGLRFMRWGRETLVPGILPGLTAAPAWFALGYFVEIDRWWRLFACTGAGALIYAAALLAFSATMADRRDMKLAVKAIRNRFRSSNT